MPSSAWACLGARKKLAIAPPDCHNPDMPIPNPNDHAIRKTCRRYNDPGQAHSLTFSCFGRQPFLTTDRTRHWLVEAIQAAQAKHGFDLWAYVFMPEHVHLLVCPRQESYDISKFLATIKLPVTRKALAHVRQHTPTFLKQMADEQPNGNHHHRFWLRGGGFDRNLWSDKALLAEIDYIHANPIRRRLCESPEEWFWSSAADHAHVRRGPLPLNLDSLPRFFTTDPSRKQRPR
jgi:putative transposase